MVVKTIHGLPFRRSDTDRLTVTSSRVYVDRERKEGESDLFRIALNSPQEADWLFFEENRRWYNTRIKGGFTGRSWAYVDSRSVKASEDEGECISYHTHPLYCGAECSWEERLSFYETIARNLIRKGGKFNLLDGELKRLTYGYCSALDMMFSKNDIEEYIIKKRILDLRNKSDKAVSSFGISCSRVNGLFKKFGFEQLIFYLFKNKSKRKLWPQT